MANASAVELESGGLAGLASQRPSAVAQTARQLAAILIVVLVFAAVWEGYKLLGSTTRNHIPFTDINLPIRSDDTSMPHLWEMFSALFAPAQRGNPELLVSLLLKAAWFTWREALAGFGFGSLVGFALGALFSRWALFERGLMPYVVASQTVPLLAIAPMIIIWGGRIGWAPFWSVAIISAYLTFFPVTINTLRGLRSPHPSAVELMRSYAATKGQILWKLRVPAALPYIFTALRVSATASVIGSIVGELPSGIADGLGRALLTYSYYYSTGPEKLWAAILVSALVGLGFVALVSVAERLVVPAERRRSE